jgi:hypothetical protein
MKIPSVIFALALLAGSTVVSAQTWEAASSATATVTRLRVNGLSSDTSFADADTGTNGFLNVGRDEIAGTTALDFSYATPTADPDIILLIQGAGEIPNSAYTTTHTTAQLTVVTPFPVIRCDVNFVTAEFSCVDGNPVTFDLTWTLNGFSLVQEHVNRTETIGPLSIRSNGSYVQRSALVNGAWTDNVATNMSGNLLDTRNVTVLREITIRRNR